MTRALLSLFLVFGLLAGGVASDSKAPDFDAELAERLGADVYGMRLYTLALLEPGDSQIVDPEQLASIQRGHLAHIRRMADEGHLVLAGPLLDAPDLRGLFILATDDLDEARALVSLDPAVQAGRLTIRLERWYGSAALPELTNIHARIARENP